MLLFLLTAREGRLSANGTVLRPGPPDAPRCREPHVVAVVCADVETGAASEAVEMLGLTRIQFLGLLRRTGLGFQVELDDEDFAQDRELDPHRVTNQCTPNRCYEDLCFVN
jgi:hypothetical protein